MTHLQHEEKLKLVVISNPEELKELQEHQGDLGVPQLIFGQACDSDELKRWREAKGRP